MPANSRQDRREHVRPPLGQTAEGVVCTREDPYFARKVVRPFAFEPGDEVLCRSTMASTLMARYRHAA